MTDQPNGRLLNGESYSEGSIKLRLQIGNRLLREALIRLFGKAKDFIVVAANGETEPAGSEKAYDLLIADAFDLECFANLPKTPDGSRGEVKVILIGMKDDPEQFLRAVRAGAAGYVMNDASATDIVAAARAPFRGEASCPRRLCLTLFNYIAQQETPAPVPAQASSPGLTLRQERLIDLVAKGLTNKEIACSLKLSEFTVRNHIHRILRKLQAGSRKEAVNALRLRQRLEFSARRKPINRAESREAQ